ncbi:hypothetical protein DUI87_15565 [Hirundo rustica rustica]|uniref:Uncharacterized protein n=1 Tax=Hirundo rustica rustica TaxID=333673 RepID=A0A3M0JZ69_HIRRU|nr:hypothetical protein DUI87_15565 [Hirundo rustica rustica]
MAGVELGDFQSPFQPKPFWDSTTDWKIPNPKTTRLVLPQPWAQHREDVELLERAQRRQQDEQRDGAALLGGKAGRAGIVQPGQEKFWAELRVVLQGLKEPQESWRETIPKEWRDRTQGMAPSARGQGWMGDWESGIVPCEGGEELEWNSQISCGCPWIPGSAQGQVGHWGLEQPGTVEGVPDPVSPWNWMMFKVPFQNPVSFSFPSPNLSIIPRFSDPRHL